MKFLFYICLIFIVFSCKKEKTVWRSNWTFPILNDTLTLNNLVHDSILVNNQSGGYSLSTRINALDLGLKDLISHPDTVIDLPYSTSFNAINLPQGSVFPGEIDEHQFDFGGAELKKIIVASGKIKVQIFNPLPKSVIYQVDLPGITKNNIDFTDEFHVPAGSKENQGKIDGEIDISGYEMDLTGINGGKHNIVQTLVTIKTPIDGGTVTLTKNDTLHIYIEIKDIKIDYARGYFGKQIISDTISSEIEGLNILESGNISLSDAKVNLQISNGYKIPAQANLLFIKNRSNFNEVTLTSNGVASFNFGTPFNLDPATGSWNTLISSSKAIVFDVNSSNIVPFIENLGTNTDIAYQVSLNPLGNTSGGWNEAFSNSSFKVDVGIEFPLAIGFNNLVLMDTIEFNLKQDNANFYIENGVLEMNVSNGFPMEADLQFFFLDTAKSLIGTTELSEKITSSINGVKMHKGVKYQDSKIQVPINLPILKDLDKIKHLTIKATINSPNSFGISSIQTIPTNAFMSFKIGGKGQLVNQL